MYIFIFVYTRFDKLDAEQGLDTPIIMLFKFPNYSSSLFSQTSKKFYKNHIYL